MNTATSLRHRLLPANPLRRFFRGKAPLTPPVTLNRHIIYILPTKAGLGFIAMIGVVLIGAMNYQNNLAYLLGFGLISLLLVTKIETYRQLLGLEISIGHIEPVFCGQTLKVPVIIKSRGMRRFAIELDKDVVHHCDDIAAAQSTITLSLPTEMRGLHKLGLLKITSRFPFSLFYAWTPMPLDTAYLVYPQIESNAPRASSHTNHDSDRGTNTKGDDDFIGIKSYHHGDTPRHIHWKAYAKGQGLQSKQFSSTQHQQLCFDWEDTQGLPLEKRLSRLTAWLLEAERDGNYFALRMPTTEIAMGHGSEHLHRCLKILATYQQGPDIA